jgi:hypothetical protein
VVEGASLERVRSAPRGDILEDIARATGGVFARIEDASLADLELRDQERFRVDATVTRPLLERWWVLTFLILLLGVEWWTRRRWGYS